MPIKRLFMSALFLAVVLLSYDAVKAQETQNPKAETKTTTFGNHKVIVTENIQGQNFENGKWLTVTRWDGTKWVSKRQFFPNKKPNE